MSEQSGLYSFTAELYRRQEYGAAKQCIAGRRRSGPDSPNFPLTDILMDRTKLTNKMRSR